MQCVAITNRRKIVPPPIEPTPLTILPYYGVGTATTDYTESLILALPNRGATPSRFGSFTLKLTRQYMYYAYPAEYGEAVFVDRDNSMEGGWDGALMHLNQLGPATVQVNVEGRGLVPFYLYRSDWSFSGTSRWRVI